MSQPTSHELRTSTDKSLCEKRVECFRCSRRILYVTASYESFNLVIWGSLLMVCRLVGGQRAVAFEFLSNVAISSTQSSYLCHFMKARQPQQYFLSSKLLDAGNYSLITFQFYPLITANCVGNATLLVRSSSANYTSR